MSAASIGESTPEAGLDLGVVVIGASLGGFDAVRLVLAALPGSFPAPIVLVQHRMSDPDGLLVELLGAESLLPVSEPEDKDPILPGHVYLAPSDYHLLVERGFFSLSTEDPVHHARPSIDVLFESAADAYGPSAIAVVLTGSNRDGAHGARAVKRAGGRVLVQDPRTAFSPVAPAAAMDSTAVDFVLSVSAIARRLAQMFALPGGAAG
ncbi:MAG TPA: chemotaxis protein CheB [Polyangiaceae bacterium]|nr:chemotaxis protein CheB [Polyangiaceae bacterium]